MQLFNATWNTLKENKGTTPWYTPRKMYVLGVGCFSVSVDKKGMESQKRKDGKYVLYVLSFVLPWDNKYRKYDVVIFTSSTKNYKYRTLARICLFCNIFSIFYKYYTQASSTLNHFFSFTFNLFYHDIYNMIYMIYTNLYILSFFRRFYHIHPLF